jgi:hypothetical protein
MPSEKDLEKAAYRILFAIRPELKLATMPLEPLLEQIKAAIRDICKE